MRSRAHLQAMRALPTTVTRWATLLAMLALATSCAGGIGVGDRSVAVFTSRCGTTPATSGVGVVVDEGVVLTAAHVVVGAGSVTVSTTGDVVGSLPADIVHLDVRRDLALLRVPEIRARPVHLAAASSGDDLTVALPDATLGRVTVTRPVTINIDDVRADTRSRRAGYELRGELVRGDSGAGLFDEQGNLVAMFFSRSVTRDVIYAIGDTEIAHVLSAPRALYSCDLDESRVVIR